MVAKRDFPRAIGLSVVRERTAPALAQLASAALERTRVNAEGLADWKRSSYCGDLRLADEGRR